jgi:hypothetical protein
MLQRRSRCVARKRVFMAGIGYRRGGITTTRRRGGWSEGGASPTRTAELGVADAKSELVEEKFEELVNGGEGRRSEEDRRKAARQ